MKVLLKPKPGGMIYTTFAKLLLLQVQPWYFIIISCIW
jgi:hypothetical protein